MVKNRFERDHNSLEANRPPPPLSPPPLPPATAAATVTATDTATATATAQVRVHKYTDRGQSPPASL